MSAETYPQPIRLQVTINERFFTDPTNLLLPETHPQQYQIEGSAADGEIQIRFWAFRTASYRPWWVSLIEPRDCRIDRSAQTRLVAAITWTIDNFWYGLHESRPELRLIPGSVRLPKRRRTKLVLILSLVLIGGKLLLCRRVPLPTQPPS